MKRLAPCFLIAMIVVLVANLAVFAQGYRFCTNSTNTWNPARSQKLHNLKPWFSMIKTQITQQALYQRLVFQLKDHEVSATARLAGNRLSNIHIKNGTGMERTDLELVKVIEHVAVTRPPNDLPYQIGVEIYIDARDESPRLQVLLNE